jgi:hypothetical protein
MAWQHDASRAQEERTAKTFGGRRTIMSGAGWLRKNDVSTDRFLIENKTTGNKSSITLKFADLFALWRNAVREDKMPVLQFDLNNRRYVVLTEDDFLGLTESEPEPDT